MDSSASPARRFGLRRRLALGVLALIVCVTVFATGHKDSKVALSASCGPAPTPVPTAVPVATTVPTPTPLDLSIPKAPKGPISLASGATPVPPAATPVATTPAATTPTTPTTPDRKYCKPGQTTPVQTTPSAPGLDLSGPAVADLAGTALSNGSIHGRKSLIFHATDPGSGVWQVEVTLGATKVVPRFTLDSNGGKCDTIGTAAPAVELPKDEDTAPSTTPVATTTPAASSTTPIESGCKTTVKAKLPVDTKLVPDGPQFLTATVWDAAGNPSVVVNREVTVQNHAKVAATTPPKVRTYTIKSVPNPQDQLDAPTDSTQKLEAGATGGQAASTTKQSQANNTAPDAALLATAAKTPPTVSQDTIVGRLEAAMNLLGGANVPYCWGGGHGTSPAVPSSGSYCWVGNPAVRVPGSNLVGLDCSSSVSWVLQAVGYPIPTMVSGDFAALGEAGPGKTLTIWANSTHVYLQIEIEGKSYYWGTSEENFEHGPNWHSPRSGAGFTARHLPGL